MAEMTYNQPVTLLVTGVSLDDCISACIDSVGFMCRLLRHDGLTSCYLHSLDTATVAIMNTYIVSSPGNVVMARDCMTPAPSIDMACSTSSTCWEADSVCTYGSCTCTPGYSYDYGKQRCSPGEINSLE